MERFDLEELRTLAFELGIDYDSLPGEGKAGKVRELILFLDRRGKLGQLLAEIQKLSADRALGERYLSEVALWNRLSDFTAAEFSDITDVVLDVVRHAIGTEPTGLHDEYGRLILHGLDVSPVVKGLRLPALLPVLFLRASQLLDADVQDIVHLLTTRRDLHTRVVLLVVTFEGEFLRDAENLLSERLQLYAYDTILVTREHLSEIVSGDDPITSLRRMILSRVNLQTISPFVTTGPTPDSMFFGRESEMREITERANVTSYAIIGGRRIGKTSILGRLHRVRLPAAGFRTLYHDCSVTLTYDALLGIAIRDWRPESPPDAPATFGDLFRSPPNDKPLILLLDEADKLVPAERAYGWQLFNVLRALSNSDRAQVVLSGERTLRDALRDPASPLFNFANEVLLGPLSYRAVEELVTRPMKQLEIELESEAALVRRIYDFTSGHPNIVQRLCHRLIERLSERSDRRITPDDVEAIMADPTFQRDDFLSTYWESATPLEKIISLLMANDQRVRTLDAVRKALAERCNLPCEAKEVDVALQRLVDLRSILKLKPDGYGFAVEAFPQVIADTMTLRDMLEILVEEYSERP